MKTLVEVVRVHEIRDISYLMTSVSSGKKQRLSNS